MSATPATPLAVHTLSKHTEGVRTASPDLPVNSTPTDSPVNKTPLEEVEEEVRRRPRSPPFASAEAPLAAVSPEAAALAAEVEGMRRRLAAAERRAEAAEALSEREAFIRDNGFVPEDADEPLLIEEEGLSKYVPMVPTRRGPGSIWEMYRKMVEDFWTTDELDFTTDIRDWHEKLTDNERYFVKRVLAFFAGSEGVVIENAATNLLRMYQWADFRQFIAFQIGNEAIHADTYTTIIDTLVQDPAERLDLFNAVDRLECVQAKTKWARHYMTGVATSDPERREPARLGELILAFGCVEGIFFSGSFCAIFWLKKRGLMPGLCSSNEFISRDEGLHLDAACAAFRHVKHKPTQERAHEIIGSAVEVEKEFITGALPVELIGMNSVLMAQYIEFVADVVLKKFGYEPMYGTDNPFDWMDMISVDGKTNFFEKRVGDYSKAPVTAFAVDDDF